MVMKFRQKKETPERRPKFDPYEVPLPAHRRLRIFSIDPSLQRRMETAPINQTTLEIPWEVHPNDDSRDGPAPGPIGDYVAVIDIDPATGRYYKPVDLNDPHLLAQDGLPPSDGNPQFHQQMVYAVAMRTIRSFEAALGRKPMWSPHRGQGDDGRDQDLFVRQLRIYPHALREANAYYSPAKKALLFGYFPATPGESREHIPGAAVFTCLSYDIIAHETTHALLDGMHRRFTEPTNPDMLAFHEAFADIVALFQHFTQTEVLEHQIAKTRGHLDEENLLGQLAQEFGRAIGRSGALRSAIGKNPHELDLESCMEPHRRGSILVAAVFDAFLAVYRERSRDLVRIATQGTGILPEGAIHPDLVSRLALEAAKTADHILKMCIRALDYMPPVDVHYGDYLRALITADLDVVSDDYRHYRVALIESFRRWRIFPRDLKSLSEGNLRWQDAKMVVGRAEIFQTLVKMVKETLQTWDLEKDRETIFYNLEGLRESLHGLFDQSRSFKGRATKGLDFQLPGFEIHSIRPMRRAGPDGELLLDAVLEVTQRIPGYLDRDYEECRAHSDPPETPDFWYRGGVTLIIDIESGELRYCIYKDITNDRRYERNREYVRRQLTGRAAGATYFGTTDKEERQEVFAFLHRVVEDQNGHRKDEVK